MNRSLAVSGPVGLIAAALLAQTTAAVHIGATVDCGEAGTYTLRAVSNGAGFEAPLLAGVVLFEEGGLLTPLVAYRNGVLWWSGPAVGLANNAVDEATCIIDIASGHWEITGIITGYGSVPG